MKRKLLNFNWLQFGAMVALIVIGTLAIRSAGCARAESVFHGMWINNLTTAMLGLAIYFALSFVDYRKLISLAAWPWYLTALVMLVAVLIFGSTVYGGKRWLWFFQPSEISKLAIIVLLAEVFGRRRDERDASYDWRLGFRGFSLAALLVGVPAALILAEPDLGTTLALVPAALVMIFVANVWRKALVAMLLAGGVAALAILAAVHEAEKPGVSQQRREEILKFVPLKDHQVRRVKVFLFPESDLMGAGYNLRQAKISIGSGGFSGKGIGKGENNHLKYLPQAISMNDFIFCVWAEETGFVGSLLLLTLFGVLLVPGCYIAFVAGDERGRLLALGVSTLVFAHVYINIAMSVGLVPITGLPLPFISSGRTFLITVMAGLGLVQSVSIHREEKTR
jgi:rod shape determining protein RodA